MNELSHLHKTWIYFLSCVLHGRTPDKSALEGVSPQELYSLAESHKMLSITAMALEAAGVSEPHFTQAKTKALRKLALFDIERGKVFAELDRAGIWYCPLKGILLKDLYPSFGMREMSDNDILCDPSRMGDLKDIMESLGYTCEVFDESPHDIYSKQPCLEFEMHRRLFGESVTPQFAEYYEGVFEKLYRTKGYEYRFSDEDFYLYLLAHEYKHFISFGTGLRSLADLYVFLNAHPDMDREYLEAELEKLKLTAFEQHSRSLAQKVFTETQLGADETEQLMLYLNSSAYGTTENGFINNLTKQFDGRDTKGVKAKYFFDRFFLTGETLREAYPFFYKHKYLLPALYVYRPVKGLITHPKVIVRDVKRVIKYRTPKNRF